MNRLKKKTFLLLLCLTFSLASSAQYTLITSASIWNGIDSEVTENQSILIKDKLIAAIGSEIEAPQGALVINAEGHTLIPGLTDAHVHLAFTFNASDLRNKINPDYATITSVKAAENYLMMGFTSVRDLGGPVFGLKQAIDEGIVIGPRIFPSGAFIGQTSGHADMRNPNEPNPYWAESPMHAMDAKGWSFLVDGASEVLKASRENLKNGATQLKLMAGGGISSAFDPIHSVQFTSEEMRAAVIAAADWSTYVAVHAYTPESITRALQAGVRCIDHGLLIDESAMKLLKEKDAWFVPQSYWSLTSEEEINQQPPGIAEKMRMVYSGANTAMELAKKYEVNLAFGTDTVGSISIDPTTMLEFRSRARWFKPVEVLRQATSENAKLFSLAGKMNPYKEGVIGQLTVGAYADLLIYDEDPLEDIEVLLAFEERLKVIIKDGKIIKNALAKSTSP